MMSTKTAPVDSICLVDGIRGVYVPQYFATHLTRWTMSDEDRAVLVAGPDHPDYWIVWDHVLATSTATTRHGENRWGLWHDGDLFAVRED